MLWLYFVTVYSQGCMPKQDLDQQWCVQETGEMDRFPKGTVTLSQQL